MAVGVQRHAPAALRSGKTRYRLYRKAPRPAWAGTENLAFTGTRHPDRPARGDALSRLRYPFTTVSYVEEQPEMETVYNGVVLAWSSLAGSSTGMWPRYGRENRCSIPVQVITGLVLI